jgi:hypothetical protein
MTKISPHLDRIISTHNRSANLQVVFVDIEKYSKRRSLTQIGVIDSFTNAVKESLKETSKEFVDYTQKNNINFQTDIIQIPTGDGAAIVFSFEGLPDIHLHFATKLLQNIHDHNIEYSCSKFNEHGWCNCHENYHVRIGVSEDRGIIYRDLNDNYNVAGNVINMAARVMGLADRSQILFTSEAFRQIVDMVDDTDLVDKFKEYKNIVVKHGVTLSIYQYVSQLEDFINSCPPKKLESINRVKDARERLHSAGFPVLDIDKNSIDREEVREAMIGFMENFTNIVTKTKAKNSTTAINSIPELLKNDDL